MTETDELILVYINAQKSILKMLTPSNIKNYRYLLSQIDDEILKLNTETTNWTQKIVIRNYVKGVNEAIKGIKQQGGNIPNFESFQQFHEQAVRVISRNTGDKLINANQYIGRNIKDNIRATSLEVVQQKIIIGQSVQQTKDIIARRLINEQGTSILMRNGRKMNVESYAELVARSTTREATNRGTMNQLTEAGYDLVKMSSHNSPCGICSPLEGRVYSISGTSTEFPPLKKAFKGIYANIHPNCRHVLMPYIPEYNDIEKDKKYSNRPFNIDKRSKIEIDKYNKEQKFKQQLNYDKRQWERYKIMLPNQTPKTLSKFREIKKLNNEKYKELKRNYRATHGV